VIVTRAHIGLAVACALAIASGASAQFRYQTVEFAELLRAHVDARLGMDRLISSTTGEPFDEPAVYITATPRRVLVYGETLAQLDGGLIPTAQIATCASGAPCVPRLRDAISQARAQLGHATKSRPKILLLVDHRVPYPTLLLLARSAAEAGAPLSIRLVARRGQQLVGIPVWVAPGRQLTVASAPSPALILVELNAGTARITSAGGYLARPAVAHRLSDVVDILGRLELSSGRNTYFISGTDGTASGDVISAIAAARDVLPNAVLQGHRERPAVIR